MNNKEKTGITNEKDHFLNKKQKELKQKIMEDLLESLYENINDNQNILCAQSVMDLIGSVIIMFNREVIVSFIKSANIIDHRKDLMKSLFENIKFEVNRVIKSEMN